MMDELIARLEKATGPDEHLDVDIQLLVNPTQWKYCNELRQEMLARAKANGLKDREEACWRGAFGGLDRYTASIDAALALVPEGWWLKLESKGEYHHAELEYVGPGEIECSEIEGDEVSSRNRPTPALAVCIAALKARAALSGGQ